MSERLKREKLTFLVFPQMENLHLCTLEGILWRCSAQTSQPQLAQSSSCLLLSGHSIPWILEEIIHLYGKFVLLLLFTCYRNLHKFVVFVAEVVNFTPHCSICRWTIITYRKDRMSMLIGIIVCRVNSLAWEIAVGIFWSLRHRLGWATWLRTLGFPAHPAVWHTGAWKRQY